MGTSLIFKLKGGSMRPFLKNGNVAEIAPADKYFAGDIVAYNINGKKYIHRILKKRDKSYFINDDAAIMNGLWINEKNILGRIRMPWYLEGNTGLVLSSILRIVFTAGRKIKNFV
jgi:hypothetical protein